LATRKAVAGGVLGLAVLLSVGSGTALADVYPIEEDLSAGMSPLENPNFDAVVVSVLSTENRGATNGDPPVSRVWVEEVLRGRGQHEVMRAVWQTQPGPGDYEVTADFEDGKYVEPVAADRWYEEPLRGPSPGERLIVFYADEEVDGGVSVQIAYEGTQSNVRNAVENLAPPERSAWVQGPLFLVIILSPVICLALFALSIVRRFPDALRRRFAVAIVPVPPLALLLYLYYESGISVYTNIRVDLLLVYPALVVALLFWPALLLRYLLRRR
jgi:hypothetical protein